MKTEYMHIFSIHLAGEEVNINLDLQWQKQYTVNINIDLQVHHKVYLLNCEYRFCDSRKSDKCFLVFAKFAKVMNVLSVLRIMQKWHAETREGPVFMQLKCMSLLLDGW